MTRAPFLFLIAGTVLGIAPIKASAAGSPQAGAAQPPRAAQPTPPCGQNMPAAVRNIDPQSRCFELRTYTVREGSAIDLLHSRFRDRTTALFRKHGMAVVGYWQPLAKPDTLIYLLAYRDSAARDVSWAAFGADPEWVKTRTEMPVSVQVESTFMGATDYSPMK